MCQDRCHFGCFCGLSLSLPLYLCCWDVIQFDLGLVLHTKTNGAQWISSMQKSHQKALLDWICCGTSLKLFSRNEIECISIRVHWWTLMKLELLHCWMLNNYSLFTSFIYEFQYCRQPEPYCQSLFTKVSTMKDKNNNKNIIFEQQRLGKFVGNLFISNRSCNIQRTSVIERSSKSFNIRETNISFFCKCNRGLQHSLQERVKLSTDDEGNWSVFGNDRIPFKIF